MTGRSFSVECSGISLRRVVGSLVCCCKISDLVCLEPLPSELRLRALSSSNAAQLAISIPASTFCLFSVSSTVASPPFALLLSSRGVLAALGRIVSSRKQTLSLQYSSARRERRGEGNDGTDWEDSFSNRSVLQVRLTVDATLSWTHYLSLVEGEMDFVDISALRAAAQSSAGVTEATMDGKGWSRVWPPFMGRGGSCRERGGRPSPHHSPFVLFQPSGSRLTLTSLLSSHSSTNRREDSGAVERSGEADEAGTTVSIDARAFQSYEYSGCGLDEGPSGEEGAWKGIRKGVDARPLEVFAPLLQLWMRSGKLMLAPSMAAVVMASVPPPTTSSVPPLARPREEEEVGDVEASIIVAAVDIADAKAHAAIDRTSSSEGKRRRTEDRPMEVRRGNTEASHAQALSGDAVAAAASVPAAAATPRISDTGPSRRSATPVESFVDASEANTTILVAPSGPSAARGATPFEAWKAPDESFAEASEARATTMDTQSHSYSVRSTRSGLLPSSPFPVVHELFPEEAWADSDHEWAEEEAVVERYARSEAGSLMPPEME